MKKRILIICLIFTFLAVSVLIYLNNVILPVKLKSFLVSSLEESTGKKVNIEAVKFDIFKGLIIKNLVLRDQDKIFASVKESSLTFLIQPFFKKMIIIPRLKLNSLNLYLQRRPDGSLNIAFKASRNKTGFNLAVLRADIINSRINFEDYSLEETFRETLDNLNASFYLASPYNIKFNLNAALPNKNSKIQAHGRYNIPARALTTDMVLQNLDLSVFSNYCEKTGVVVYGNLPEAKIGLGFKERVLNLDFNTNGQNLEIAKEKLSCRLNSAIKGKLRYNLRDKKLAYSLSAALIDSSLSGIETLGDINKIQGEIKINNQGISSENLSADIFGTSFKAKGNLENFADPVLNVSILSSVNLNSLQDIAKDKFKIILPFDAEGQGKLFFTLEVLLSGKEKPKLNGFLDITQGKCKLKEAATPIENINGGIKFTQNDIRWEELAFKFQDVGYKTDGRLSNFNSPQASFDLTSKDLALKSELAYKDKILNVAQCEAKLPGLTFAVSGKIDTQNTESFDADLKGILSIDLADAKELFKDRLEKSKPAGLAKAEFTINGPLKNIKACGIDLRGSFSELSCFGLKAGGFDYAYNQKEGLGEIPLIKIPFYDGSFLVKATFDFTKPDSPYSVALEIQDAKLEKIKSDISLQKEEIGGIISATATIEGFGRDIARLTGSGNLRVKDGNLWHLNLFQGMGSFLLTDDFENLIFYEGSCDFVIKDKAVFTDNLLLKSKYSDLFGSVKIGFDSSISAAINVEVNDEFVPETGGIKDVTTAIIGQSEKFGVIEITGTLKDPKYQFKTAVADIFRSIKNAIFNK